MRPQLLRPSWYSSWFSIRYLLRFFQQQNFYRIDFRSYATPKKSEVIFTNAEYVGQVVALVEGAEGVILVALVDTTRAGISYLGPGSPIA